MLNLKNICLIAIGSTKIEQTKKAIDICLSHCEFKDVLFFSDNTTSPYSVKIDRMNSIKDYDYFVLKKLPFLINNKADYYLTIHWDGFVVNPKAWTDDFLLYDYIGAPWPWYKYMCGNGGFCLKSQKFISTQITIIDDLDISRPDDVELCLVARKKFEDHGCKYAPTELGFKFSTETGGYHRFNSFGFHDFKYNDMFRKFLNE
jgi:hypothetical protein